MFGLSYVSLLFILFDVLLFFHHLLQLNWQQGFIFLMFQCHIYYLNLVFYLFVYFEYLTPELSTSNFMQLEFFWKCVSLSECFVACSTIYVCFVRLQFLKLSITCLFIKFQSQIISFCQIIFPFKRLIFCLLFEFNIKDATNGKY